jgi:hypothetical protein
VKLSVVGLVASLALLAAGSGSAAGRAAACPAKWRAGWQQLANRVGAPVFCPRWMPNPLDAKIGGEWDNGSYVSKERGYLVSFLMHDQGDVHVNFRGYPGRTAIPRCATVDTVGGKVRRGTTPCFADPHGTKTVNGIKATLYTVNQDADQWHILYAWRQGGSLYALSEHVIQPLGYKQVKRNLDRILASLVLVRPTSR